MSFSSTDNLAPRDMLCLVSRRECLPSRSRSVGSEFPRSLRSFKRYTPKKMTINPAMREMVLTPPDVLKPRKSRKDAKMVAVEKQT